MGTPGGCAALSLRTTWGSGPRQDLTPLQLSPVLMAKSLRRIVVKVVIDTCKGTNVMTAFKCVHTMVVAGVVLAGQCPAVGPSAVSIPGGQSEEQATVSIPWSHLCFVCPSAQGDRLLLPADSPQRACGSGEENLESRFPGHVSVLRAEQGFRSVHFLEFL